MDVIKIELDNKTFKLPKPRTYEDLRSRLISKFGKHEMQRRLICYRDAENDEVVIECEADLEVAFQQGTAAERLTLKQLPEPQEDSACVLKNEDLGRLYTYLDSLVDHSAIKKVEKCFERNAIPCPVCFTNENKNSSLRRRNCVHCEGSGSRPMTRIWNLVLFLVDCKIKEYILNPLTDLVSDKTQGNLKEEAHDRNSTKISFEASRNYQLVQNSKPNNGKNPPDFLQSSVQYSMRPDTDFLATKANDVSLFSSSSINLKSFKKQNTFIGASAAAFGPHSKQINLSFPDYNRVVQKHEEDERFFTKEQLHFHEMETEAWLGTSNTVEVRLLLESVQDKNWPLGVRIRGKDCELTKNVDIPLEKRLKAHSIIGIKFNFSVKGDLTDRAFSEPLCFEFVATDFEKNIKYFSRPLKLQLHLKKNTKLNMCTLVR